MRTLHGDAHTGTLTFSAIGTLAGTITAAILACSLALPSPLDAQVLYRRPYDRESRITAGFDNNGGAGGCSDYECGGNCYDGHTGTDFGVPMGTPVLAGASGTVIAVVTGCPDVGYYCSPCGGLCGNHVRVRHGDGSETRYCHMQNAGMTVSNGQSVACGQQLGHSASSGCSTGAHLHFGFQASAGAAADDPFRGRCGGPDSRWTGQGAYGSIPGTSCQCVAASEACNGRDDDCDGRVDESDVCEVGLLVQQPGAYAPPRTTDVDGDGRADVCARGAAGVSCWRSTTAGWGAPWAAVPLTDASGWADVTNYATLRMGDLDGDGRADLCARADLAFRCALSTGTGFGSFDVWRDGMSDENGWAHPQYYTTLRLEDVDGDGRADLCARDSQGFGCWLSNGTSFDRRVEGPRWSDTSGFAVARYYGTLRMGDLDGDGRADVCVRAAAGIRCALSDGEGFPTSVTGPDWSDEQGFGAREYWSTLRFADIDGDRRDDLCIRTASDLRCALSRGDGFGETVVLGAHSNANGWADPTNYATFRAADVDGDGRQELCARADATVSCWGWNGTDVVDFTGPAWSDASGWSADQHYETFRMADFDGDGRDDYCARAGAGWRCHASRGTDGFGDAVVLDDLTNAGGWGQPQYWSTILFAGTACVAATESCNGRDDDCDGDVDEGAPETCNGRDDDCDDNVDENMVCAPPDTGPTDRDAATIGDGDGGRARLDAGPVRTGRLESGCGCRAVGGRAAGGRAGAEGTGTQTGTQTGSRTALLAIGVLLSLTVRRRARGRRNRRAGGSAAV